MLKFWDPENYLLLMPSHARYNLVEFCPIIQLNIAGIFLNKYSSWEILLFRLLFSIYLCKNRSYYSPYILLLYGGRWPYINKKFPQLKKNGAEEYI